MNLSLRALRVSLSVVLSVAVISCGGGGKGLSSSSSTTTPTGSNVVSVIVDSGPLQASVNTLFTTVTICVPGSTTQCATIDHVQVDTASFGFRVLAAALPTGFTLPPTMLDNTHTLVECTVFGDGYSWGPVVTADFTIGGESVSAMPLQLIGDTNFLPASTDCSSQTTGGEEDTVMQFGANGIIGIGVEPSDCPACTQEVGPQVYYSCTSATACTETIVTAANVVPNPISRFSVDNNGSFVILPSVPDSGGTNITGSLVFGVDTQSNNQSGTQTVVFVDPSDAQVTMVYKGSTLADSFIDSGTNGIYFSDTSLATCPDNATFYCPTATTTESLGIDLKSGSTFNTTFDVVNADIPASGITAFPGLAGTLPASLSGFDYGLAFFYGRRVANVIAGSTTSVGSGPYIAF
jgi:Protein of unknown function (DUF3443)